MSRLETAVRASVVLAAALGLPMSTRITHLEIKSLGWAGMLTAVLAVLIVVGSRRVSRFDPALVAYTFASLFAVFGIAYRYAMWLQRPTEAASGVRTVA